MKLRDRSLPRFEVSSDFETFEKEGLVMSAQRNPGTAEFSEGADEEKLQVRTHSPKDSEETFEEKVDAVIACVGAQNALREVLFKTLEHCEEPREFSEVEEFISQQDEFIYSHIIQTPYTLIQMLIRAGGLKEVSGDMQDDVEDAEDTCGAVASEDVATAEELTGERDCLSGDTNKAELDEDSEIVVLQTTPEGCEAVRILDPAKRIRAQLLAHPNRCSTYLAVLDFCKTPRTFPEIQSFFKTTPGLAQDVVAAHHKLSPDYYVDKLDKAGALVWRGAWVDTEAGLRALSDFSSHKQTCASESSEDISQ